MSRSLSTQMKGQVFSFGRDDPIKILLQVTDPKTSTVYRFVNDITDLVSNGDTYLAFPFEVVLPQDDENLPAATLRIQNVDDRIGRALIDAELDALQLKIMLVMASTPDTIEITWDGFELVDVEITPVYVSGQIVVKSIATEPWPSDRLTLGLSPVFFR